jgi:hypothetical protein
MELCIVSSGRLPRYTCRQCTSLCKQMQVLRTHDFRLNSHIPTKAPLDAWNGIQLGSVCKAVAIFIAEEGRLGEAL